MKFTVEVEEFWLNEDGDLTEELTSHITKSVVYQISKSIEKQVAVKIELKAKEAAVSKLDRVIDDKLTDLIDKGVITYNREEISLTEYIEKLFMASNRWNNPQKQLENITRNFAEELKLQYNAAFANLIVQNMKKQGFLKDYIAQILLNENN